MPENTATAKKQIKVHHRGRGAQVGIYLGKLLRMFIYQNDWKVLPMSALIAGLVAMVVRKRLFIDMEGSLTGAFAIVCVGIWNGCFNSIQSICRERDVIKREHRLGMHISSYICAHMIYQALLCLAQTFITLHVLNLAKVHYPLEGQITPYFMVDFGISLFLITYAADMMSLWISSLARSTTTAMTIMPFVLIFQLVFSGGMLNLPPFAQPMTNFTISNPGLKLIAAQADVNSKPFVTISNMLSRMHDKEIGGTYTLRQLVELLQDESNPTVAEIRAGKLDDGTTVGKLIDAIAEDETVKANLDEGVTMKTTVGEIMDLVGEDKVTDYINKSASEASFKEDYVPSEDNIMNYWFRIFLFVVLFAALATITLEFIDKDKR